MISDAATPDFSVIIFFIKTGHNLRQPYSCPNLTKRRLSSVRGFCALSFTSVVGLQRVGNAGGSGSLAAFRATVTHGFAVFCGFWGSWYDLSLVFVALGAEVIISVTSGCGVLPLRTVASVFPIANAVTMGGIFSMKGATRTAPSAPA